MTTVGSGKESDTMRRMSVLATLVIVLAACGGGDTAEESTTTSAPTTTSSTSTTTTTIPTTTTTLRPLTPDDFQVELFVIEDQCYDSAGALVTVEPELALLSGEVTVETLVVFEISGIEGGSSTYNLTVSPDGNYTYDQELLSTETCDHELTVEVVSVRESGRSATSRSDETSGSDDVGDLSDDSISQFAETACEVFEFTLLEDLVEVAEESSDLPTVDAIVLIGLALSIECPDQLEQFGFEVSSQFPDHAQAVMDRVEELSG